VEAIGPESHWDTGRPSAWHRTQIHHQDSFTRDDKVPLADHAPLGIRHGKRSIHTHASRDPGVVSDGSYLVSTTGSGAPHSPTKLTNRASPAPPGYEEGRKEKVQSNPRPAMPMEYLIANPTTDTPYFDQRSDREVNKAISKAQRAWEPVNAYFNNRFGPVPGPGLDPPSDTSRLPLTKQVMGISPVKDVLKSKSTGANSSRYPRVSELLNTKYAGAAPAMPADYRHNLAVYSSAASSTTTPAPSYTQYLSAPSLAATARLPMGPTGIPSYAPSSPLSYLAGSPLAMPMSAPLGSPILGQNP